MKHIKIFFLLSVVAPCILLFVSSCAKESPAEQLMSTTYSENYVMCYLSEVDTLYLTPEDYHDGRTKFNNGIYLNVWGKECTANYNKETFDFLSHYYDDTTFHLSSFEGRRNAVVHASIAEPMLSITVISDKDFDEKHPAGTPLDDIVFFSAGTPYPFIKSGYKKWYERIDSHFDGGYTIIEGTLSELNPEDLVLLNTEHMYIDFPLVPKEKEHNITVKILFKNGKVLSASKKSLFMTD